MKALLIDDEPGALLTLRSMLSKFAPEVQILAEASSLDAASEILARQLPDVVFLDMDVKGRNGLLLLEQFTSLPFEVIIVTAYAQFALPSYSFGVADYLVKPISPALLKRAVARVEEKLSLKKSKLEIENSRSKVVKIQMGYEVRSFPLEQMIRLEASRNYSNLYVVGKPIITLAKTLAVMEEQLQSYGFIRLHNSHLINPQFAKIYHRVSKQVELKDSTRLPVSRERRKKLNDFLSQLE